MEEVIFNGVLATWSTEFRHLRLNTPGGLSLPVLYVAWLAYLSNEYHGVDLKVVALSSMRGFGRFHAQSIFVWLVNHAHFSFFRSITHSTLTWNFGHLPDVVAIFLFVCNGNQVYWKALFWRGWFHLRVYDWKIATYLRSMIYWLHEFFLALKVKFLSLLLLKPLHIYAL